MITAPRALALAAALGWASPAAAGVAGDTTIAVTAGGGWDFSVLQPWAGLDVSFHPDQPFGFSFVGRVRGAWAFERGFPFGVVEAGFAGVVPADTALIRLGVVARTMIYTSQTAMPLLVGDPDTAGPLGAPGFLPGGMAIAELGWNRFDATKGPRTWSLGLRVGAGLGQRRQVCESGDLDDLCLGPGVAVVGGFHARMHFHEGVFLEAMVGPTLSLSLGYGF